MLAQNVLRAERLASRTLPLCRGIGIDLLDQPRDQFPIHLRAEVTPEGKLGKLDGLFRRIAPDKCQASVREDDSGLDEVKEVNTPGFVARYDHVAAWNHGNGGHRGLQSKQALSLSAFHIQHLYRPIVDGDQPSTVQCRSSTLRILSGRAKVRL